MPSPLALPALILALRPAPPPPAPPAFSCDTAEEVYEESLGELSGRPVFLRICTAPVDGAGQRALARVNWQAADGEADVWQTLVDGPAEAPAGNWTPTLEDGLLTLRRPSGGPADPQDQYTIETWRWREGNRRFEEHTVTVTSPWSLGMAELDRAFEAGDLEAARAVVARVGTTPNGGLTWVDDEIYLRFLAVAHEAALRRHRLWDDEGAAEIAWRVLADPPVTAPRASPNPGELVICRDLAPACAGEGQFVDLPRSVEVANRLAALAFVLAEGGRPEAALSLLDPLLAAFPLSGGLERTRADALWASDRKEEARQSYQKAAALGVTPDRRMKRRMKP